MTTRTVKEIPEVSVINHAGQQVLKPLRKAKPEKIQNHQIFLTQLTHVQFSQCTFHDDQDHIFP